MAANSGILQIDNAEILFRNFAGREGQYNAEGDRNFCVLLDDKHAEELARDGWNVKHLRAREEGDIPQAYLAVSVKYQGRNGPVRPPTVVMITSEGQTSLPEDMVEILDYVDIDKVDLLIRPFQWAVSGKSGTKAYLQSIYITIREDALALRYRDVPKIGQGEQKAIGTGNDDVIDVDSWDVDDSQLALER